MDDMHPRAAEVRMRAMTVQEVQRQTQKQPFGPFRVLTAHGQSYDARHPEHLASSGKGRRIAIGTDDDSFVTLDLPVVTAIHRPIPKERATRRKAG